MVIYEHKCSIQKQVNCRWSDEIFSLRNYYLSHIALNFIVIFLFYYIFSFEAAIFLFVYTYFNKTKFICYLLQLFITLSKN